MKKLHSLAFYALVTPTIALGSGAVLAEQSGYKDVDKEQQSAQPDQDAMESTTSTAQSDQKTGDQSSMQNQGYLASAPANGMQASDLIGADVKTTGDEDVGAVSDLIIDQNGQVVAVVVGVGGFLGMGEKDVAIGWDDVTKLGASDEQDLRIDLTREDLEGAPEFERQE
ncbi:PRC-barrel domain-containing protein [Marinobacter sp. HN1S83]|uniref:PRC-barrel domain-containing protein n=1 Tax=Marinobacter sp. HN1S83 TaxID=3382301 RepID=UPI00387B5553